MIVKELLHGLAGIIEAIEDRSSVARAIIR
jgi:hypothetical protein